MAIGFGDSRVEVERAAEDALKGSEAELRNGGCLSSTSGSLTTRLGTSASIDKQAVTVAL